MLRLKELRGNRTQAYVAIQLNLPRETYRSYETGSRQPNPEMLMKMADYFDCSVDYLLGRKEKTMRLREIRKSKHLTMKELATFLNVSEGAISQYENGKRCPDYTMLIKIADYFDVSLDYLLGRTDEKNRYSAGEYPERSKLELDIKKLEALPPDKLGAIMNMINTFIN